MVYVCIFSSFHFILLFRHDGASRLYYHQHHQHEITRAFISARMEAKCVSFEWRKQKAYMEAIFFIKYQHGSTTPTGGLYMCIPFRQNCSFPETFQIMIISCNLLLLFPSIPLLCLLVIYKNCFFSFPSAALKERKKMEKLFCASKVGNHMNSSGKYPESRFFFF